MKYFFGYLLIFLISGIVTNQFLNLHISVALPLIFILLSFLFRKKSGLIFLSFGIFLYGMSNSYRENISIEKPYVFVDCLVVSIPKNLSKGSSFNCFVLKSDIEKLNKKKVSVITEEKDICLLSEIAFIGKLKDKNGKIIVNPVKGFIKKKNSPIQFFYSFRKTLIENYRKNSLTRETFSVGKALIFGDKSEISYETKKSFIETGLSHLLAISGLHIGILVGVLVFLIRNRFIRDRLILFVLPFYAVFTGLHIPVVRASLMGILYFYGSLKELRVNPLNILFFVAFVVLLFSPETLFSEGFQLSFIATLGILLALDIISVNFFERRYINIPVQLIILSFIATVFTLPIVLYYFNAFSPVTVLATPVTIIPLYAFIFLSVFNLITGFFIEPLVKLMDVFCLLFLKAVEIFHFEDSYLKGFSPGLLETIGFILLLVVLFSIRLNVFHKLAISVIGVFLFLIVSKTETKGYRIYIFEGKYRPYFVVSETGKLAVIVSNGINRKILRILNRENPKEIYVHTKHPENFITVEYKPFPVDRCVRNICIYRDGKDFKVKIENREIKIKNKTYIYELEKK